MNARIALLFSTLLLGLLLRWQMAGQLPVWSSVLDLRRAHSHLGFYGVLFPAAWICWQRAGDKTPSSRVLAAYFFLTLLSAVGFVLQGYGKISIAGSTGVLAVWLLSAWQVRTSLRTFLVRGWLAPATPSILVSALLIPVVAATAHKDPNEALIVARTFLGILLLGVFLPTALRAAGARAPVAGLWLAAALLASARLSGLFESPWTGAGPTLLAALTLISVKDALIDRRLKGAWGGFALALAAIGLRLIPYTHSLAIAGIHFLILGPLAMTFSLVTLRLAPPPWLRLSYELSVAVMVSSIAIQDFALSWWIPLQWVAALSGTLILALIAIATVGCSASAES